MTATHRYDDIIDLPHHVSQTHAQMPASERAAQFSPFAALTGYDDAVAETRRLTEEKIELDESQKLRLGRRLALLCEHAAEQPALQVRWFCPDKRKAGGACVVSSSTFRKIDELEGVLLLGDGTKIPLADLYSLESPLLDALDSE